MITQKNIYEIGFLINPDLSQQEAGETLNDVKNIVEKQGASVISEGEVVDIDLAYQIITKIASKNERFDKGFFTWIKFEATTNNIESIKKEIDKIKLQIFRYLITKTVVEDKATDRYQEKLEEDNSEEKELKKEDKKEKGDSIDTTTMDDTKEVEEKKEIEEKEVKNKDGEDDKEKKEGFFKKMLG